MNDLERFDVYRVAVDLHVLAVALVPRGEAVLRDQLERASLSVVLNIAEGVGRRSVPDRKRYYTMAYGSASESRALLDVLERRGLGDANEIQRARTMVVRVVKMLVKLTNPAGSNTNTKTHTYTDTKTNTTREEDPPKKPDGDSSDD